MPERATTINFPADRKVSLKKEAAERHTTMERLIVEAFDFYIENFKTPAEGAEASSPPFGTGQSEKRLVTSKNPNAPLHAILENLLGSSQREYIITCLAQADAWEEQYPGTSIDAKLRRLFAKGNKLQASLFKRHRRISTSETGNTGTE